MKRLIDPVLRRCLAAACVASLMASSAMAANVSFLARPRYNGVPNQVDSVVIYNLPASGSIYAGPVNTSFDLAADIEGVSPPPETAAAFALIATIGGTGQVIFNPPPIVDDQNNLEGAKNPLFPANNSFDLRFASTGIQGGGAQEIDVTVLEEVALQNNPIADGEGLLSIPVQVAPGVTGDFDVSFSLSPNYTGFVRTLGQNNTEFLTNAAAFPHTGTVIEVRRSRKGDLNGDGNVNAADIGGFIAALNNINTFRTQFPYLHASYISDINEDTNTNAADIGGFITVLNNPGPSPAAAVPEPTTLGLAGMALAALGAGWLRRRTKTK